MNRSNLILIAALGLLGSLPALGENPEVLIVGDVTADVPVALRPAPGKPIHYLLLGNTEMDLGSPRAGMPRPDPKAMETELARVLASQGFIMTKVGGPMPQIALTLSWGTANLATEATPGVDPFTGQIHDPDADPDATTATPIPLHKTAETWTPSVLAYNLKEMRQLLGLDKPNWQGASLVDTDRLGEALHTDRVYLSVIAFDLPELVKKKKVVLWRTRMSIDSLDHSLPDSFAIMLASAGPYFGRNTDTPVLIDDRVRQANVSLGEFKVLEATPGSSVPKPGERDRNR